MCQILRVLRHLNDEIAGVLARRLKQLNVTAHIWYRLGRTDKKELKAYFAVF